MVRRQVAMIAASDSGSANAAKAATTTIPIVFGVSEDPVHRPAPTQRYRVFEVSELEAEKALRSYLRDRDEKIISLRIRELTRSEAASLNLSSGKVKLLDLAT